MSKTFLCLKSKFTVHLGILMGSVPIGSANAAETNKWSTKKAPAEVPVDWFGIAITYIIDLLGLLIIVSLAILVSSILKYVFFTVKREEQKKIKSRKILFKSLVWLLFLAILYSLVVLISSPCCLSDI